MTTTLIVYGSRHGGTRAIAVRLGTVLEHEGIDATVTPAESVHDVGSADAVIVGSAVYMGSWLDAPLAFLSRNQTTLASRPTWLFSSGPLRGSSKEAPDTDPITNALGPADGPGSGGRKKVEAASAAIHPREHKVFFGAFDPTDPPKAFSERAIRMMPGSSRILPPGDFRDWDAIDAWAREIAAVLTRPSQESVAPAASRA